MSDRMNLLEVVLEGCFKLGRKKRCPNGELAQSITKVIIVTDV
jgi:hypothetical protein